MEKKVRELREYIRQVLLTEAAYSVEDLVKEDDLYIMIRRLGSSFRVKYVSPGHDFHPTIKGNILIRPVRSSMGNCLNAYMVATVTASEGHGPLLYDIAMELATENGGGLMADRSSVSGEARAVWEYYMNNRDDVMAMQLDDAMDSFDNGPEDDCDQMLSKDWPGKRWQDTPLSKVYRKDPTTLNALEQAGRLKRP